ncbi:hypothetical protein JOF53_003318 [Crossiella equi]|uniref:ESX secretion-associated protein EspG n=1 Tax=Crossiella equi TaxID=130796 RepID=A0ABS5ACZ5_9PSEU|nr:ESX secretion-associated protein EspG [Crossiella equi]MBP2474446.1 hypothetical protein [Crossiella equi]
MTEFTLTAAAVDLLWRRLDLGPMPLAVRVPPQAHTEEDLAAQSPEVDAELCGKGLLLRGGVHPELVSLLRMLARPEHEVDARLFLEQPVRALAASAGDEAALVVLAEDSWRVRLLEPTGLVHAVLGLLPDRPPGTGESVSLPSALLTEAAASGDPEAFEAFLAGAGVARAAVVGLMLRDPVDFGQFGVAAVDPAGRRRRAERVVAFHDTAYGRYLVEEHKAADGTAWTTISPADTRRLHGQLTTLSAELDQSPRPARSPAAAVSSPGLPRTP